MRRWPWAVVGMVTVFVALVGILAVPLGGQDGAEGEQPLRTTRSPQESPEERERRKINIAVSGADGELEEAVRHPEGWSLRIEMQSSDADLPTLLADARTLFQELARTEIPMREIIALVRTDVLKDVYGHRLTDVAIARVALSGETFRRINWHGFQPENFLRVADDIWVHDFLSAQIPSLERQGQGAEQGEENEEGGQNSGGEGEGS